MGYPVGRKRDGRSKYRGVYATGRVKKPWRVTVYSKGVWVCWGSYETEEQAARKYNSVVWEKVNLLPESYEDWAVRVGKPLDLNGLQDFIDKIP